MDQQKIKSLFIFIILTVILFYLGNMVARKSNPATVNSEQSTKFLDTVAMLDTIQFDFDFINSLGSGTIKTDVYIQPLSNSDVGRDNPFMRSNPSSSFGNPNDIPTNFDTINAPGIPGIEESQGGVEYINNTAPVQQSPPDTVPSGEQSQGLLEELPQENQPEPAQELPSATLTR